ncbi:MAG: outer membrane protein assembly factor BamD [Rikenellaceae bacterium]
MVRNIKRLLLMLLTMVLFTSCGGFDKMMKSRDYPAMYEAGLKYFAKKKDHKAIQIFSQIEQILDGTSKADTIKFYLAKANYRQGKYAESAELLDAFRKQYTRSVFAEEAEYLYAMSFYESSPNPDLDQTPTNRAIVAFHEYIGRYPDSPKADAVKEIITELKQRLYDKSYQIAETYYNIGAFNSAITSFKNTLKTYPEIPSREDIMYYIVKSNYLFARKSVEKKQRERYYNTIDAVYNFQTTYPESKYAAEVKRILNNSEKLSRGKQLLEKAGDDALLSEKQILKGSKRYEKLQKKVDKGRMTADELETMTEARLQLAKEKAKKRNAILTEEENAVKAQIAADNKSVIKDKVEKEKDAAIFDLKMQPTKEEKPLVADSTQMKDNTLNTSKKGKKVNDLNPRKIKNDKSSVIDDKPIRIKKQKVEKIKEPKVVKEPKVAKSKEPKPIKAEKTTKKQNDNNN